MPGYLGWLSTDSWFRLSSRSQGHVSGPQSGSTPSLKDLSPSVPPTFLKKKKALVWLPAILFNFYYNSFLGIPEFSRKLEQH